jgi:hypothetical protein
MRCPSCGALTSQSDLFHVCRAHSDPLRQQAENAQLAAQQNVGDITAPSEPARYRREVLEAEYQRGVAEERRRLLGLMEEILEDNKYSCDKGDALIYLVEELRRG